MPPSTTRSAAGAKHSNHRLSGRATTVTALALSSLLLVPVGASAKDTRPPTRPGPMSLSQITDSGAKIHWRESFDNTGVIGYRIYRRPPGARSLALIDTADGGRRSYTAVNLRSGGTYQFGVVAIDADNNKSAMRLISFKTRVSTDRVSPAAPLHSVQAHAFSARRIDLLWTPSASLDVAYYQILRNGVAIDTVARPKKLRYSDNGLKPSTSYKYSVRAVDSAGNRSAATTPKTARTLRAGQVEIARGPYTSRVSKRRALISWWTNIPARATVRVAGKGRVRGPAGRLHHVVRVSRLTPGTRYAYRVVSGRADASGSFWTAAPKRRKFSFAVIGDFGGQSPYEQENADRIAASRTQFIQTVGDNVYPSAGLPDPNFARTYSDLDARIFKQFEEALKTRAFFPANGNKEYYGNGQFWRAFPMPGRNHSWYSYNWGSAHILVLDSQRPLGRGSAQRAFARADLAHSRKMPWRIVVVHSPPFNSSSLHSSNPHIRRAIVRLVQKYKVRLVLSGDVHNYERTYPLVNGVRVKKGGVTYVTSGGGGNGLNKIVLPRPAWSAFRRSAYEYVKVTVAPRHLQVRAVDAATGEVFDATEIVRPR